MVVSLVVHLQLDCVVPGPRDHGLLILDRIVEAVPSPADNDRAP